MARPPETRATSEVGSNRPTRSGQHARKSTDPLPDDGWRVGHRHRLDAALQPSRAVRHAVDRAPEVAQDGGPVSALRLGDCTAQQPKRWLHHGEIDEVTTEHPIV